MKKVRLALVLGILGLFCFAFTASDTVHKGYFLLRAEANENAATIDLTSEGDFAQKPSGAIQLKARNDGEGHGGSAIEVIFAGGSAAGKTFTYTLYGWRRTNGPARFIATGTGTLGTQAVVKYPDTAATATSKFWADTLSVTGRWLKAVSSSDTSGNNEVASLQYDFCGYEWLYVEIQSADGTTGSEAGSISVYYSYF